MVVGAGAWDWQVTVVGFLISGELYISFQVREPQPPPRTRITPARALQPSHARCCSLHRQDPSLFDPKTAELVASCETLMAGKPQVAAPSIHVAVQEPTAEVGEEQHGSRPTGWAGHIGVL